MPEHDPRVDAVVRGGRLIADAVFYELVEPEVLRLTDAATANDATHKLMMFATYDALMKLLAGHARDIQSSETAKARLSDDA